MNATNIFILVGLSLAVYLHSAEGESRQKRSLWNLYQLLKKVANVDALKGLNGHGNYCGWGGSGTPVDGMDRCCQQHDNCYRRKPWYCLNFKWLGFNYRCSGSICYCLDPSWSCRGRACSCDLVFAKCVRRYRYLLRG